MLKIIRNKKDWRKISLNEEELKELNNMEKQINNQKLLKKIQCIKLKNKNWKHDEIASFLGVSSVTISSWIKIFIEQGISKLLEWNYKGKVSILTLEQQEILKQKNKEKPFSTAKEVKKFIKEEFNIDFHLHWIQKLLKKNFDFHTKKLH